jgi:phospholipid/cholesterol/gamma-HCH transport system substrate-binding protein
MSVMGKNLRVGAFVLVGLLISSVIIFVIGDTRRVWDPKYYYNAEFSDVVGLKAGSPVRMGGLDIGSVDAVSHSANADDSKIHVRISVARSEARRIRSDSVLKVVNKGLLGDKMVEVSVGTSAGTPVPDGSTLKSEEPVDLSKYLAKFESIANKTEATVTNLERATRTLGDPKLNEDVKGTIESLHVVLDGVAKNKDGAAHKIIFDPEEGKKLDRILGNLEATTANLNATTANVAAVTGRIKDGPGLAHTVLYDDKTAQDVSGTLAEVHDTLTAVRTGKGLAHVAIYGDDNTQHMLSNVSAMTDDLRTIVANVKAGKGTVGALLVDPSVYEDIKAVIGNVERNQVLRAIVRYSIKQDEGKNAEHVETPQVTPVTPITPAPKK